jgi:hypothetical protein
LVFARHFFIALVLSLAAIVSACQSPGNGYLMNGIGAELSARDIESATTLQRKYFDHLCAQAGLGDGGCALGMNDRASWTLVVQQGMNDIDRRCDAYLEWLDNQKRNRGPLLSQVSAVQNTASAIIGFVAPGSTKALNVVLAAFGLLTKSIENYNSRLILDIESSTINSVVLRARNDFRQAFSGKAVGNKPEAEYVLREYLRRCLPFAIETQINDLSTLGSRGIRADESNSIFVRPVALGLLRDTPESSISNIKKTQDNMSNQFGNELGGSGSAAIVTADLGGATSTEQGFDVSELETLQVNLCVPVTGSFDEATRAAISKMQDGMGFSPTRQISGNTQKAIALGGQRGCDGYVDAFEKFRFRSTGSQKPAARIAAFQGQLKRCADRVVERSGGVLTIPSSADPTFKSGILDSDTRALIGFVLANVAVAGDIDGDPSLTRGKLKAIGTCARK